MARQEAAPIEEQPLGRRERKRLELRGRLGAAALELFSERGYEAVSMTDIADRVVVARATVFNYFPKKEMFLEEWGIRRRDTVVRILRDIDGDGGPALHRLRRYLGELVRMNTDARAESIVLMTASARFGELFVDPALSNALAPFVAEAQRAGEVRSEVNPRDVGDLLSASYFVTVLRWADADPPFDLARHIDAVLDMVLDGVRA
jgi:AcrR family transcriptional regulator